MSSGFAKDHHVAVLAFPFGTHGLPLLNLVQRLAKAAPNAMFSFFSTAKSNATLFSGSTTLANNIKAYDVHDGVPEGYVFIGKPLEDINLFLGVAPESFKKGVEAAEKAVGRKISCVMADAFLWFSCEIAEEVGVPWVAFWTSGAAPLSAHLHTDLIRQTIGLDGNDGRKDELIKFIPGFSAISLGDLPSGILFGHLTSPFSQMLHKMGQILPKANAVVINSFEELDPQITSDLKSKFSKFLNVGTFNLITQPPLSSSSVSDVHGCVPWLDHQKDRSVVYIGFGTVATPPPDELKALAEALEACKIPFLWSLKDNQKCNLPQGFVERTMEVGKIVPWAPQVEVLTHKATGVIVTHCGWNSVLESIAAGVPIIGRPFLGDQQLNATMVEKVWKIGVRIEGGVLSKDGTMQALELVLSNEKGINMKKQVGMLRELALKSIEPNGSSTQNFAALLSLWS